MRIFPIIRKIVQVVGDGLNFRAAATPGIRLRARLDGVFARTVAGVSIARTVADLKTRTRLGIRLQTSRTGDHAKPPADVGIDLEHAGLQAPSQAIASQRAMVGAGIASVGFDAPSFAVASQPADAGARIVHTRVDLDHESFVTVASESVGSDWENIANSEDAPDGAHASLEEGIVLVQGTLIGDWANQINRTALTITRVAVRCHYAVEQFLLAGTSLTIQYRVGALGTPVVLKTITGGIVDPISEDHLVAGEEFDITDLGPEGLGGDWEWPDLSDVRIEYVGTIVVDVGLSQVLVDATALLIEAFSQEAA